MSETGKIGVCQWRYALVDGVRTDIADAQSGDLGECEVCHGQLRARKGDVRVPHWAHVNREVCDAWHEAKGEWHVKWQNEFPANWRECLVVKDQERHIADMRNEQGLVIEFQHSAMNREEQEKREKFYGNMIWVVDGTRLKNDKARFIKNVDAEIQVIYTDKTKKQLLTPFRLGYDIQSVFPRAWLNCSVPVLFDFREQVLWCLLPGRMGNGYSIVLPVLRSVFFKQVMSHSTLLPDPPAAILVAMSKLLKEISY